MTKLCPRLTIDWNNNVGMKLYLDRRQVGMLVTNKPEGLRLHIRIPRGALTPVQMDRLGKQVEVKSYPDYDVVQFTVTATVTGDRDQWQALFEQTRAYARIRKTKLA